MFCPRSRSSSDASVLANVYELASSFWFEQNLSRSALSEEDRAPLDDDDRNTTSLHHCLYSFDMKALEILDVDGTHAAKEVTVVLRYCISV